MSKRAVALVGGLLAVGGVVLLATKAQGGGGCFTALPMQYYYATWLGADMTLPLAFGPAVWQPNVIYTVDFLDAETGDWVPPADPTNYVILHGDYCRFMVQVSVEVCGFRKEVTPA